MSEIHVGENESLENALKRFKRKCARAGVLAEVRKREHYEKPSVKRKKKEVLIFVCFCAGLCKNKTGSYS